MAVELSNLLAPWFGEGLIVEQLALNGSTLHLQVMSAASEAGCPLCGQRSSKLHSRYTRTLHDLPFGGFPTVVHLRLHRFRCLHPDCVRQVFCERLPLLVMPYAQRTLRCTRALTHLASTAGGRGGARLGTQLDLTASASTLIRQLHRPLVLPPRRLLHVGIDDFAFRKGQTYGTVIVDLDTHRPVEILLDRTTTVVADWLRQHPEIEVVTRDRSTEFACAVTQSLPNAVQVLDRWHLLKSLREALERFLGRHQNVLRETTPAPKPRSQAGEEVRAQRQQRHTALLVQMQVLRAAGVGTRVIARQLGVSRYLVKRYLQADAVPARRAHTRVRSILDPYLAFLNGRWDEGCRVGAQLLREVQSLGYPGTRRPLDSWLRARRAGASLPSPAAQQAALYEARAEQLIEIESTLPAKISPQELVWLLWKKPEERQEDQQAVVAGLTERIAPLADVVCPVHEFIDMLEQKNAALVASWLERARGCASGEMQWLARSLTGEQAALEAAVSLPWSNGPVEGVVNKIKLIKRQMYGRAALTTLRSRILTGFGSLHQS